MSISQKEQVSPGKEPREISGFLKWIQVFLRCATLRARYEPVHIVPVLYNISVMAVCGASGWFMFYLKYHDLSLNTDVLLHAVCTVHTLYIYIMLLYHKEKLYNIYNVMRSRFQHVSFQKLKFEGYQEIWDKADGISLNLLRFGSYLGVSVYSMYLYNCNPFSTKRKLVYPLWVPYSLESHVSYFTTIILQLSIFALYLFINVSKHGFGIGGAHFIGASVDVLGKVFREMCDNTHTFKGNANQNERRDAVLHEELKSFVQIHDSILDLIKDYKSVYEVIYVEVLLSCEIVICFCGFQLVMSEQFRISLYLSKWEDQSFGFKRSFSIMLTNTAKPIIVSYKGVLHSSMHSFLNAMKTAFSYINILLILRDIHQ